MIEMQMKKRNKGIDLIKIVATIAVVMIHGKNIYGYANIENDYFVKSIAFMMATGVPLFYIASGYLWGKKTTQKKVNAKVELLKICKTLVIPYVVVNIIWLCFEIIIYLTLNNYSEIKSFSVIDCISYITWRPIYSPFWFIRNLVIVRIISIVLESIHVDLSKYVFIAMFAVGLIEPFPIDNHGRVTLVYYGLGVLIGKRYNEIDSVIYGINKKTRVIIMTVAAICLLSIHFTDNTGILRILTLVLTISETVILLSLGEKYKGIRCLDLVGTNSFFIYAFHGKLLSALQITAVKLLPQSKIILFLEYIGCPAFVIFILIFASMIAKKHVPYCYSLVTGGR